MKESGSGLGAQQELRSHRPVGPTGSLNQLAQRGNQSFPIERLGEVMIKAGHHCPIPIFGSRKRRNGNSGNAW